MFSESVCHSPVLTQQSYKKTFDPLSIECVFTKWFQQHFNVLKHSAIEIKMIYMRTRTHTTSLHMYRLKNYIRVGYIIYKNE